MTVSPPDDGSGDPADGASSVGLWPSADYDRQVARLRAAVGETVYLVELVDNAIHLAVHVSAAPVQLLGVIDFPRPDPPRGLSPHLILLDDGRGLNLGRIARISRRSAFAPAPEDVLFLDSHAHRQLLFGERRLSRDFIAGRSAALLGQLLGGRVPQPAAGLTAPPDVPDPTAES